MLMSVLREPTTVIRSAPTMTAPLCAPVRQDSGCPPTARAALVSTIMTANHFPVAHHHSLLTTVLRH